MTNLLFKIRRVIRIYRSYLLDIKHIDDEQHKKLTGWTNKKYSSTSRVFIRQKGNPVWIRHVLVPERSDYDEYLIRLSEFVSKLKNVIEV